MKPYYDIMQHPRKKKYCKERFPMSFCIPSYSHLCRTKRGIVTSDYMRKRCKKWCMKKTKN